MLIRLADPDLIITAFDQDHGGFDGSVSICKRLAYELGKKVVPTFSPEGNDWNDTFWGQCDGVGLNHLGKLLMRVREEIRAK